MPGLLLHPDSAAGPGPGRLSGVALVSLNVRGIDRQDALPLNPGMIGKALAAAVWGDTLAIARDQLRPLEARPGSVQALWQQWVDTLDQDLVRTPSHREILARCREITASFRAVETAERPVQDVAVVGEIYTKNCRLGNWNLRDYLAAQRLPGPRRGADLAGTLLHGCTHAQRSARPSGRLPDRAAGSGQNPERNGGHSPRSGVPYTAAAVPAQS